MSWGTVLPTAAQPRMATVRSKCIDTGKRRNQNIIIYGGLCIGFALIFFSICLLVYGGGLDTYQSSPVQQQSGQQQLQPNNWPHSHNEDVTPIGLQELNALMSFSKHASSVRQQLEPILAYKHTLPPQYLRKSQAYTGNNPRLRRVVKDLLTGENEVKIGVIGGSISFGHGTTNALERNWFTLLSTWLASAFPRARLSVKNGCIPATPAAYMYMCLELSVEREVDLLFVEYLMNDGFEDKIRNNSKVMVYERLVRKVMAQMNHPAVALYQVMCQGDEYGQKDGMYRPFPVTLEEVYGAVAQYYDINWLSMRNAVWDYAMAPRAAPIWFKTFMNEDARHPNDLGHVMMADIAVWMIQRTAIELLTSRPFSQQDALGWGNPLPQPMYPGNTEGANKMCIHNEELKQYVVSADGWDFKDEARPGQKPKLGYVSTQPGSILKIKLNTVVPGKERSAPVAVILAYLKSYAHMGIAHISCVGGCACTGHDLDGQQYQRESTTHLHRIVTTQHEECTIAVIVTRKTSSRPAENKFKISGVMLSDETTGVVLADGAWHAGNAQGMDVVQDVAPDPAPPTSTSSSAGSGLPTMDVSAARYTSFAHAGDEHPVNKRRAEAAALAAQATAEILTGPGSEPAVRETAGVEVQVRAQAASQLGRVWQSMVSRAEATKAAARGSLLSADGGGSVHE